MQSIGTTESTSGSNKMSPSGSRSSSLSQVPYARTSCDTCKRMKIKCERKGESCVSCVKHGAKCEMTFAKRKRIMKKHEVALLKVESRLERMESLLTASGINPQFPERDTDKVKNEVAAHPPDRLATLVIDETGSSCFVGASSGFSLFSPQGLQWISERTQNNELSPLISGFTRGREGPSVIRSADLWQPMSPLEREPLPPKEVADQYVKCFFDTFNNVYPLFDMKTFYDNYTLQYSSKPPGGSAWYSSLNVVICIGSMIWRVEFRDESCVNRNDINEHQSWKYFRNACSCFVDLIFKDCNLMAVQAICGMAFIQQISSDPKSVFVLTAAASRLAYAIGLNRKLDSSELSQAEIFQRRNVFWIVYFLDKNISLRIGHPSAISDDDIGVELPQKSSITGKNLDGSKEYDIFNFKAQLALLESRIYADLYSIRSRNKTRSEQLVSVGKLDQALQEWRQALPVEIRPEEIIQYTHKRFVPVAMLHLEYFNCLKAIHRSFLQPGSWISDSVGEDELKSLGLQLNPRVYTSYFITLTAARNSIQILQYLDLKRNSRGGSPIFQKLLDREHCTSLVAGLEESFLTLFANILQNPQDTRAGSDLELMGLVVSALASVAIQSRPSLPVAAVEVFRELNNVASKFVEQTNQCNITMKRTFEECDAEQEESRPSTQRAEKVDCLLHSNTSLDTPGPAGFLADDFIDRPAKIPSGNPTFLSDTPLFTDFFEWDLANLCNYNYMQDLPAL